MTYEFLQHYWWFLVSLLGSLLVFLLFVQGGQSFIFSLAKNERERLMLVNALGRKWEFTFTTLVTFGGAFFASFPLFYSTSFGGAYWVWIAILFMFVLQAVAYEFRTKPKNVLGQRTFEVFLFLNGVLGTILLGTAVGTFFTGSDFTANFKALTDYNQPIISYWNNPWHGLEAVLDARNLMLGVAICFLARVLSLLYFINLIDDDEIQRRAHRRLFYNALPFVVFFVGFVVSIFLSKGFAVDYTGSTPRVFLQPYKYFLNFVEMPILLILFLLGVLAVLFGIIATLMKRTRKGIWFSGIGTVLTVLALLLSVGYNNTSYYPSIADLQSSLTIYNSSSSEFTLQVMSVVSLLIPFVLAYIVYAWHAMDKKKMVASEFDNTPDEEQQEAY